jgi:hypothetical protein
MNEHTEKALNLIANANYLHQLAELAVWIKTLPLSRQDEAHVNDAHVKRAEEINEL